MADIYIVPVAESNIVWCRNLTNRLLQGEINKCIYWTNHWESRMYNTGEYIVFAYEKENRAIAGSGKIVDSGKMLVDKMFNSWKKECGCKDTDTIDDFVDMMIKAFLPPEEYEKYVQNGLLELKKEIMLGKEIGFIEVDELEFYNERDWKLLKPKSLIKKVSPRGCHITCTQEAYDKKEFEGYRVISKL